MPPPNHAPQRKFVILAASPAPTASWQRTPDQGRVRAGERERSCRSRLDLLDPAL